MPKNKKPAGGRPAKNFDPSYADRRSGGKGAQRPGSRSPGHRGHRADDAAPRKARWNADERAARAAERSGGGRDERSARPSDRDERGPRRSFDRDDRPQRSFNRDDRAQRSFDRDDRAPRRSFDRDDRPQRSFNRDDRPQRSFNRDDRAPRRSFDRDDRPQRSFNRDDRPQRSFNRDDRPQRPADRGDRAPRREQAPRSSNFYPSANTSAGFTADDDVVLERLEAQATVAADVEGVTFGSLGLGGNIERALAELGAPTAFPIQAATIPDVLAGRDVLGRGRTGSGKTIAFGAPLVEKLMENGGGKKRQMGRKPRALILAPTRELALQIDRTVQPIARSVGLFTTQIYGGVPQHRQVGALQRGVDIIVGTPGRIEDLIEQGRLDLSEVTVTVLDEADHMCDLGFLEPVQRIIRQTAPGGQKLLFSATLDKGVAALVNEFLTEPSIHEVAGEDQASSTIDHRVLVVEHRNKDMLIEQLADRDGKTLIFSRTRAYAERLTDQLEDAGIRAVALHGDLNQSRRTRNLQQLTSGRVSVLVATDVAARGIHVDDIDLVVQADAPDEYKTYLHRAGRTGRAGKEGRVVTLIPRSRRRRMADLLSRAEIEANFVEAAPGDDVVLEIAGEPTVEDLTD
ncbi:DEAD/DEAH box helicase [Mycetocola reblochoni]|uniref:DEAD-box ATP-dependent RNA helicase CshA n=2 Tax=Mycetocola reblochoni TaxID=331618 RepID=A0A1R4IG42_9MICO|nr:DEAD/DEAH box helicase [Mycetocola reblochoni]SJN18739.1 DEAD-box ATP-dependent RNA helicase CshA [Mycetocola reblochoni REB411]